MELYGEIASSFSQRRKNSKSQELVTEMIPNKAQSGRGREQSVKAQ